MHFYNIIKLYMTFYYRIKKRNINLFGIIIREIADIFHVPVVSKQKYARIILKQ